jgi:hypothetical protein
LLPWRVLLARPPSSRAHCWLAGIHHHSNQTDTILTRQTPFYTGTSHSSRHKPAYAGGNRSLHPLHCLGVRCTTQACSGRCRRGRWDLKPWSLRLESLGVALHSGQVSVLGSWPTSTRQPTKSLWRQPLRRRALKVYVINLIFSDFTLGNPRIQP